MKNLTYLLLMTLLVSCNAYKNVPEEYCRICSKNRVIQEVNCGEWAPEQTNLMIIDRKKKEQPNEIWWLEYPVKKE